MVDLLESRPLLNCCKVSLEDESGSSDKAKHGSRWGKFHRAVVLAVFLRPRHADELIGEDFEIGGRIVLVEVLVVSHDVHILVVD